MGLDFSSGEDPVEMAEEEFYEQVREALINTVKTGIPQQIELETQGGPVLILIVRPTNQSDYPSDTDSVN